MLRDRVCVKSHHTTIPPTSDASVGTQQIYDTTTRRSNGRKATLTTLPLKPILTVKQTRVAQKRTTTSFLLPGHLKGGADDLTLERLSLVTVLKLKQKQQNHSGDSLPTRSHIASPSHCTLSRESRLVPMLLCSGSDGLGCGLVQKAPRSTETVIVLAKQLNNK